MSLDVAVYVEGWTTDPWKHSTDRVIPIMKRSRSLTSWRNIWRTLKEYNTVIPYHVDRLLGLSAVRVVYTTRKQSAHPTFQIKYNSVQASKLQEFHEYSYR